MRMFVCAAAISCFALPAYAQSHDRAEAAARALDNPIVQEALAATLDRLAGIVLDTRVGAVAALDPHGEIRPDDTLRDLQARRDPGFEARLHDRTREAMARAGSAAIGVVEMRDSIDETAARLRAALAPLRAALASPQDR